MKREKLTQALNEISDSHLLDAVNIKRKRALPWLGAVAAVLALVLFFQLVEIPMAISANAVSIAASPRLAKRPDYDDYQDRAAYQADWNAWTAARDARSATANFTLQQSKGFFSQSLQEFLSGSDSNTLYSPVNAYIGLAMVAELTAGNTRQQLLDALNAPDTDTLRTQVSALWESAYLNENNEICTLASSVWLDKGLSYNQSVMDVLAYHHYASVYQRELNSTQTAQDVRAWLNNNTGGFLKEHTGNIQLPEEALLVLYSTIYFQGKWSDEFNASNNTTDVFHGTSAETDCTYMNARERQMHYYWGDSYGAVSLSVKGNRKMWFLLPDEGKSVDDILAEGQYLDMLFAPYEGWKNSKYMKVNLSIPKFDISAKSNLRSTLENMGITDIFKPGTADFSASLEEPAYITAANQSVRVAIDEQGVTAAAYIELPGAGAAMPPEEIIDFVLDRPFLFVITGSNNIPLFAGVVNQP